MKNTYTLVALLICTALFAQQNISFETSEGYSFGNINNQKGWVVPNVINNPLTKQVISNATAKVGALSFKNGHESAFGIQFFPIFGAMKTFDTPASSNNFTISYDVKASTRSGSDWEFTLYAIDGQQDSVPIAGIGLESTGYIYMITDTDYNFEYATKRWVANEWTNIKISITTDNIKYYVNNVIQGTFPKTTSLNILGLKMLHNNYGGDAFYDNIQITTGSLSTQDFENTTFSAYPNPTTNSFSISSGSEIAKVNIFAMNGQKVLETTETSNINVSQLSSGIYLVQATDIVGNQTTLKLVKK